MIGIDTNVLIRYLVRDDEKQYQKVLRMINEHEGSLIYINEIVFLETWWVLRHIYGYKKRELINLFRSFMDMREVVFFNVDLIMDALDRYQQSNSDLQDCLIAEINHKQDINTTYTFDKKASKPEGMKLLI